MTRIKTFDSFVNEQLDDFFEDFNDSEKNIKLFTTFSKISTKYENTEIKVSQPKQKFQTKIRTMNKRNDKGIF
jgi:hypothetical protein